jgi:hypothetical protein
MMKSLGHLRDLVGFLKDNSDRLVKFGRVGVQAVAKSCMATVRFIRAAGYFCCPDFS